MYSRAQRWPAKSGLIWNTENSVERRSCSKTPLLSKFPHNHLAPPTRTHPIECFFGEKLKRRKKLIWYTHNSSFDHPAVIITRQQLSWGGFVPYLSLLSTPFHVTTLPPRHHMQTQVRNQLSVTLRSWTSDRPLSPYLPEGQQSPDPSASLLNSHWGPEHTMHISRRQEHSPHHPALYDYCLSLGGCKPLGLPPQAHQREATTLSPELHCLLCLNA